MPFGFSQHNPDDKDGKPGDNPFDFSQLGNMLSQLGAMLSNAGTSSGPVNYDLAKQVAFQQLSSTTTTIGFAADQSSAVTDAVHLAEMWLDPIGSYEDMDPLCTKCNGPRRLDTSQPSSHWAQCAVSPLAHVRIRAAIRFNVCRAGALAGQATPDRRHRLALRHVLRAARLQ